MVVLNTVKKSLIVRIKIQPNGYFYNLHKKLSTKEIQLLSSALKVLSVTGINLWFFIVFNISSWATFSKHRDEISRWKVWFFCTARFLWFLIIITYLSPNNLRQLSCNYQVTLFDFYILPPVIATSNGEDHHAEKSFNFFDITTDSFSSCTIITYTLIAAWTW